MRAVAPASYFDVYGAAYALYALAKISSQDRADAAYRTATHADSFYPSPIIFGQR